MFRTDRILWRLVGAILVLLMAAFPAVGSGTARCCVTEHPAQVTAVDEHACCSLEEDASSNHDDRGDDSVPPKHHCAKCLHACCRTADVAHVRPVMPSERTFAARVLPPEVVAQDAVAAEAIFHPPRA